jgi:two-component system, OmpR family, response regulator VicR
MNKIKKTVLLIEDETMLNDAFTILLSKNDFDTISAFNGKEALEILANTSPDIILLDLLMPVMDGRQFLAKYINSKKIPIIIFSNLDAKNDVQEALDLGATRYILKAWAAPKELVRIINDTINS